MNTKQIKERFENITGLRVYRNLPFGINIVKDLELLTKLRVDTIFDVGANVGQSAIVFAKSYPKAKIYCFEPFEGAFERLISNTAGLNCLCTKIALGSTTDTLKIQADNTNPESTANSLIQENNKEYEGDYESIDVITLDEFCHSNKINAIDFLKIDTEGYDLEVLKGAKNVLSKNVAKVIQVEVSLNTYNTFHVDLIEIRQFLDLYNYKIFGVYNQTLEWKENKKILRRANIIFVSDILTS